MRAFPAIALVLLLAAGCGGGGGASEARGDLPLGRTVSATGSFEPTVHLFAEPVVARIEVVVDRDQLDPGHVRVEPKFLPYDVNGTRTSREDRGRLTVLRYDYVLRCLRIACVPKVLPSAAGEDESGRGERQAFDLPAARVYYDEPGAEARVVAAARWSELVSVSRIKQSDVPEFGFVFKTHVTPLPEPDYRVSPTALGLALLGGALVLLVFPAVLAVRWWRRRHPPPVVVHEPEPTPLERALRLVEWAAGRQDGTERREALEVLAVELDGAHMSDLATSARTLAWSPASPTPHAAAALTDTVRSSGGSS